MGAGLARRPGVRAAVACAIALAVVLAPTLVATPVGSRSPPVVPVRIPADAPAVETRTEAGPVVAYGNTTIVLPDWNSLSGFAWNCNTNVSISQSYNCFSVPHLGRAGSQVPLLSWTADGAFYVNSSFDLVFYSFLTHTVTGIAAWLPLYDNTMDYTGATNTEYLTTDGTYVYEFGCLTPTCRTNPGTTVTSYAVNVTTGRTFEHNWTNAILTGTSTHGYTTTFNAQMNMVGLDGNDSILALTVTWAALGTNARNGTIWAYNLWTGVEWKWADLPFFEANNLYWLPQFSQFFDVSAEDSNSDEVYQEVLSGNPAAPTLVPGGPYSYSSGKYGIGGVDGLWVDTTTQEVAFQADWQGHGEIFDVVAQLGAGGWVTGFPWVVGPSVAGTVPSAVAGEHRSSLVTTPLAFSPPQGASTDAWLSDPLPGGSSWTTNVSQSFAAWDVDGSLFYNTSYSILTPSVQCERVSADGTSCPLFGTSAGTVPGTLWWTWQLGDPEFPFPSDAPLAEPLGPAPVVLTAAETPSGVQLNWTVPPADVDPFVNYSLSWGNVSGEVLDRATLPPEATSYSISGFSPGDTVYFTVTAWNLHGPASTSGSLSLRPGVLPGPPSLAATYTYDPRFAPPGEANLTVTMNEGSAGASAIVNDTLSWGSGPGALTHELSGAQLGLPVGTGQVTWKIADVAAGATYSFAGVSWNSWGEGPNSTLTLSVPSEKNATSNGGFALVPILEVAGGVLAVVVGAAVVTILQRRRRARPPSVP